MHVDVTETNANVEYITREAQQRWGEQYVLVTADGLELENCEGTKGRKSWGEFVFINIMPTS